MKIEYNNLYIHFIFSTTHRMSLITEKHRERIEKYMTGIVNNNDSQLYAIYVNPGDVHFLVSRSPKLSEENLASIVAESSQSFINKNKLCSNQFACSKDSFGGKKSAAAFSVSKSDNDRVCIYILNQPEHHRKVSFAEEYEEFILPWRDQKTLQPFKEQSK